MAKSITKELRELPTIGTVKVDGKLHGMSDPLVFVTKADLERIADRIDREHESRMESCKRETLRRCTRYIRRIATYYEHGVKMVPRKGRPEPTGHVREDQTMTKEETKAAIERLKAVDFKDTDSHDRLARICNALYQPEHGWTKGACDGLRQFIIDLLNGYDPDEWSDSYLDEVGLVRLPKDADGEYVHIGDVMELNDGKCFVVVGIGDNDVFFVDSDDCYEFSTPETLRHHKLTVEDVLREFAIACEDTGNAGPAVAVLIAEYADKLREVMADE